MKRNIDKRSCIYLILNLINGNMYVGSAVDYRKRKTLHLSHLRRATHGNIHLQRAFSKYGEGKLMFVLVEVIENKQDLIQREQFWIDALKPEYNICKKAGSSLGVKRSDDFKKAVAERMTGNVPSLQTRERIGDGNRGKTVAPEVRKRIADGNTGKKYSPETCKKISDSKIGKPRKEETVRRMAASLTGKKQSEDTKRKRSESLKGRPSPLKGRKHSPESNKKTSDGLRAYHAKRRAEKENGD